MRITVLGPVEVTSDDGVAHELTSPSQRTIAAMLACRRGSLVPVDALVDALWGDDPPPSATTSLRSHVSRLRQVLGDRLTTHEGGYSLAMQDLSVDALDFERLVAAGTSGSPGDRRDLLGRALQMWRGPLLGGEAPAALAGEARRFEELRCDAVESLAAALLEDGRAASAVAEAEALLAEHPLREHTWAVLVRALAVSGRQAEALRAFQRAAEALGDAGLEPSPELREAERFALEGPPPGSDTDAEAASPSEDLRRLAGPKRRIRLPPDRLVGREEDLEAVAALHGQTREVTLVGPGGVGKTRLALEVASRYARLTGHDVIEVELGPVTYGGDLGGLLVDRLGLATDSGEGRVSLATAGSLDALLLLDNCEHLLEDLAPLVEVMTAGAGGLRILATSRERLRVGGEHTWTVEPLGGPTRDGAGFGVELFTERAAACLGGDTFDEADGPTIARIVERLDGLPLAIEMAASSLAGMGLDDLDEVLEGRLDHQVTGARGTAERHRTLDALVRWSTERLAARELATLEELTVFAAPVDRETIAQVVGRDAATVQAPALAERSLLALDRSSGQVRYRMLDTIRRRVSEGAGDLAEVRERHARHHLALVADLDGAMRSAGEADAVERLEQCFPELPAVLGWATEADPTGARELLGHLYLASRNQIRDQPLAWAEQLLAECAAGEVGRSWLLACVAQRAVHTGELSRAEALAAEAHELDPDSVDVAELYSDVLMFRGSVEPALRVARELADRSRARGDHYGEVLGRVNVALSLHYSGATEEARAQLDGLTSDVPSLAGWLAFSRGETDLTESPADAVAELETAISLADGVRNRMLGGVARVAIASLLARDGEIAPAARTFREILAYWRRNPSDTYLVTTLRHLVVLLVRMDRPSAAARLLGAVELAGQRPSVGDEARALGEARDELGTRLGAQRLAELTAEGAELSLRAAAVDVGAELG